MRPMDAVLKWGWRLAMITQKTQSPLNVVFVLSFTWRIRRQLGRVQATKSRNILSTDVFGCKIKTKKNFVWYTFSCPLKNFQREKKNYLLNSSEIMAIDKEAEKPVFPANWPGELHAHAQQNFPLPCTNNTSVH